MQLPIGLVFSFCWEKHFSHKNKTISKVNFVQNMQVSDILQAKQVVSFIQIGMTTPTGIQEKHD